MNKNMHKKVLKYAFFCMAQSFLVLFLMTVLDEYDHQRNLLRDAQLETVRWNAQVATYQEVIQTPAVDRVNNQDDLKYCQQYNELRKKVVYDKRPKFDWARCAVVDARRVVAGYEMTQQDVLTKEITNAEDMHYKHQFEKQLPIEFHKELPLEFAASDPLEIPYIKAGRREGRQAAFADLNKNNVQTMSLRSVPERKGFELLMQAMSQLNPLAQLKAITTLFTILIFSVTAFIPAFIWGFYVMKGLSDKSLAIVRISNSPRLIISLLIIVSPVILGIGLSNFAYSWTLIVGYLIIILSGIPLSFRNRSVNTPLLKRV